MTIPYDTRFIDLADVIHPRIGENSLQPFLFDPNARAWEPLDAASLGGSFRIDPVDELVSATLPADLLTRFPSATDPSTEDFFLGISGPASAPVPEPHTVMPAGVAALVWFALNLGKFMVGRQAGAAGGPGGAPAGGAGRRAVGMGRRDLTRRRLFG